MIEYNTNKKQTINNILDTLETVQSNLRRIKKDEENYHVENMGYTFIASDMTSLNKNNNNHNGMNNYWGGLFYAHTKWYDRLYKKYESN